MGDLFGGVESNGLVVGENHLDACSMMESAQLFKRFRNFERSGGPSDKILQEVCSVTVQSNMAERWHRIRRKGMRNRSSGEVEGIIAFVENDFDDVGVG